MPPQYTMHLLTPVPDLPQRIGKSVRALAVCWLLTAIAVSAYVRDGSVFLSCLFWSAPFFAAGWVLAALPAVATGNRILRVPAVLVGFVGAVGGLIVMLLPVAVFWPLSRGKEYFLLNWEYFRGWPSVGAGNGAIDLLLYRWLLSRTTSTTTAAYRHTKAG